MASNQFVVDLGHLDLNEDQRQTLNSAIQGAVTNELAKFKIPRKIVLIPVDKWPKGPILQGIIARPIDKNLVKELETFM